MHLNRRHRVVEHTDLAELATKLKAYAWTLCTGFAWRGLTLLNDSTSEDALAEYAVIRDGRQVESLTIDWISHQELVELLAHLAAGGGVDLGAVSPRTHPAGACPLCA